jgi:4-amino-4-deoxy-L-arabinose transferase-like glycosyltransferase
MPRRKIFGLWLMALVPLMIAVDGAPVQRTQEARVMETARQMLGRGAHAWLIPSVNGETRLRKPPLAYWMAAASFKIFGVSEDAGRLPTILLSWLLVGATYAIAARLFDQASGLFAAGALLSSYLFFRFSRLAETDLPAAFFATVAADFFWRALDADSAGLFHAAAAMTGLSFFAKQGPGFFPLLFFVAMAIIRKKPRAIGRFFLCGAPVTLLVLAGWWYAYAICDQGMAQFKRELAEVAEGIDHPATFLIYFPWIMLEAAPWSLLIVGAVVAAIKRVKTDAKLLGLCVWAASDLVPLCFLGNKQEHYLLPLMPPLMILAGWLIRRALAPEEDPKLKPAVSILMGISIIASIGASAYGAIAAAVMDGTFNRPAFYIPALIAAASIWTWFVLKKRGLAGAAFTFAIVWSFALPLLLSIFGPRYSPADIRAAAAEIKQLFGDGPYLFYGPDASLPLCFALRREIHHIREDHPEELIDAATKTPGLIVVWHLADEAPALPLEFQQVGRQIGHAGQAFNIYQLRPMSPP